MHESPFTPNTGCGRTPTASVRITSCLSRDELAVVAKHLSNAAVAAARATNDYGVSDAIWAAVHAVEHLARSKR